VLDLGCGDGRLAWQLAKHGIQLYDGVDYSKRRIEVARAERDALGMEVNGYAFSYQDAYRFFDLNHLTYSTIFAIELLEHLEDPQRLVSLTLDRLNDNGRLIATVPKNMPYHAHLQVWESEDQLIETFPSLMALASLDDNHWVLYWGK
jgi:2-polyprenyl-3-methyl-5-hydroxy-6-metoxy-1,4-benzoquinol methylase